MRPGQAIRIAFSFAGRPLPALGLVLGLVLAACQEDAERLPTRGTEAENEITGQLVNSAGDPVPGARVTAYPGDLARQSPASAQDSALTDVQGRYTLKRLMPGPYNLVGGHPEAALAVLIPGIEYREGPAIDLGTDTLLAPGSLEGRVLQGNAGKAGVLVYAPGTSFLAVTDAAGAFRFPDIPDGTYRIRYQVSGFQVASDSGVIVHAGLLTRLADKILALDTAMPPPAPAGVSATFDTLNSRATLSWDSVAVADLAGYRVYRDDGALSLPVAISGLVAGTRFTDTSLGRLAEMTPPPEVGYRIRTLDKGMNEGEEFSPVVRVRIIPRSLVTTRLLLAEISTHPGKVGIGKPAAYRVEFENPTRRIRKVAWRVNSVLRRETGFDHLSGSDTLTVSWTIEGFHTVDVVATDEAGAAWTANFRTQALVDAPVADAGQDKSVSLGDSVRLRPTASDILGEIVSWEWDIGGKGVFQSFPSGAADFQMPASPMEAYPCILRVTDDEGLTGLDTMNVRVLVDAPTARATASQLEAFVGDTVYLSASASRDGLGNIVRTEWDVGATGNFVPGADEGIEVTASGPQSLPCALKVTDDDGQTDTAMLLLSFVPRDRWLLKGMDPLLQGVGRFHTWSHSGRLWLMAEDRQGVTGTVRLWNTQNMLKWDLATMASFAMPFVNPAVQGGRIWMVDNEAGILDYSDDGLAWERLVSESFPKQLMNMRLLEHAGKLWLLGTRDSVYTRRSEVWNSSDGRTWNRVTNNPEYGFRVVTAAASWKGRLWIFGNSWSSDRSDLDLWSSADGLAWRKEASGIFPGQRQSVNMFVHKDELWMMSGRDGESLYWGELRRSGDGRTWVEVPGETPTVTGQHGFASTVVFDGQMWLLSSSERESWQFLWEIWQGPH